MYTYVHAFILISLCHKKFLITSMIVQDIPVILGILGTEPPGIRYSQIFELVDLGHLGHSKHDQSKFLVASGAILGLHGASEDIRNPSRQDSTFIWKVFSGSICWFRTHG